MINFEQPDNPESGEAELPSNIARFCCQFRVNLKSIFEYHDHHFTLAIIIDNGLSISVLPF